MADIRKVSILIHIFAVGSVVVPLQSCTKNTEQRAQYVSAMSAELGQEFSENYDGVQALSDKLVDSNLDVVRLSADDSVSASKYNGSPFAKLEIDELVFWRNLLNDAGVDTAYKTSDGVTLMKRLKPVNVFGNSIYEYLFFSSAYDLSQNCVPRHFGEECGACIEQLNGGWHLIVSWFPVGWADELEKSGDPISKFQSRIDACFLQFTEQN